MCTTLYFWIYFSINFILTEVIRNFKFRLDSGFYSLCCGKFWINLIVDCNQEYFWVLYDGWVQKWDGELGRSLRIKCLGGVEEQLTGKLGLGAWEELQQLENAKVD